MNGPKVYVSQASLVKLQHDYFSLIIARSCLNLIGIRNAQILPTESSKSNIFVISIPVVQMDRPGF